MKKAIIFGCFGMDGSLLAELLSFKGYEVYGIGRPETSEKRVNWLKHLVPNIKIELIDVLNDASLYILFNEIKPDEVYNFAGVSNVFEPMQNAQAIFDLNAGLPLKILENIRLYSPKTRFFQASSALVFGNGWLTPQNELSIRDPLYLYGCAKNYADSLISQYRKQGINARSGILYPHTCSRRAPNFFCQKIVQASKNRERVKVGSTKEMRSILFAPEAIEGIWRTMQAPPEDYVIGNPRLVMNEVFIRKCFEYNGLNYKEYIEIDESLKREESVVLQPDISKIKRELGWSPQYNIDMIITEMMEAD